MGEELGFCLLFGISGDWGDVGLEWQNSGSVG